MGSVRQHDTWTNPTAGLEDGVFRYEGLRVDADAILDDHVMLDHAMAADGDGIADDIALAEERTVAGLKAGCQWCCQRT